MSGHNTIIEGSASERVAENLRGKRKLSASMACVSASLLPLSVVSSSSFSSGSFWNPYFYLFHPSPPWTILYICIHVNAVLGCSWLVCFTTADEKSSPNSVKLRDDWRKRSRPIPPGGTYPAKDHCRFIFLVIIFLFYLWIFFLILGFPDLLFSFFGSISC